MRIRRAPKSTRQLHERIVHCVLGRGVIGEQNDRVAIESRAVRSVQRGDGLVGQHERRTLRYPEMVRLKPDTTYEERASGGFLSAVLDGLPTGGPTYGDQSSRICCRLIENSGSTGDTIGSFLPVRRRDDRRPSSNPTTLMRCWS